MPEEDPKIFSIFQTWLYTSEVSFEFIDEIDSLEDKIQLAIDITIFGDRNGAAGFHNRGIELLVKVCERVCPSPKLVRHAYEKMAAKAPLCLCLHKVTSRSIEHESHREYFFMYLDSFPYDFVKEVLKLFYKGAQSKYYPKPVEASSFYIGET